MKIMVINPNTSVSMTDHLRRVLTAIKRVDNELTVLCPVHGPVTIETAYDEAWAVVNSLELVKRANEQAYDAVVLACFSDPGLTAAREVSRIPVVGIGEASMHMACMLGAKFSVLTTRRERAAAKYEQVAHLSLDGKLASVLSLDLTVAETDANPELTKQRAFTLAKKAADEDGAEVIVLGCAGMAGYAEAIKEALGIVVLDPSAVALKTAEAMADLGLKHAKRALYSTPPGKEFK